MKGDFSRWTAPNAAHRDYKGVLMQQGRPMTDADWNEQVLLDLDRTEGALRDMIGASGTPKGGGGFQISPGAGGFRIGAGRYYIGGALVRNPADTTYEAQGGDVAVPPLSGIGGDGSAVIVYLEADHQHVTALDDTRLADPALGGIDTATRIRAGWRVGVERVRLTAAQRADLVEAVSCGAAPDLPGWAPSTGAMSARTLPAGTLPEDSDCEIPPEAGYLSQENQLYRVQIIRGGSRAQARFVWSRENGSVLAELTRNTDGDFVLQGDRDDEALRFKTGDWVEVFDAAATFNMRSGTLHRLTLTGGEATFAPALADFNAMVRPRLRRWDHGGTSALGLPLPLAPTELERGIEVSFSNGSYRDGDHWIFEARAATGTIAWPQHPAADPTEPVPPMGWGPRRAALALATIQSGTLADIADLRAEFPHLACLSAEDVGFDDTRCDLGADTVQEAIEALCRRTSSGLCTVVVSNARELIAAVAALGPRQSVRLCLRAGQFALPRTLEFPDLGHVTVEGTGPQTVVSVAEGEAAFAFTRCASVRVVDMSLNGGPTGQSGRLVTENRLGAVSAIDCGDMSFERLRLRCRSGLDRQAACISTRNRTGHPRVLVRDCTMRVGQSQIGVQIIGAGRAIVQDNAIAATPVPAEAVRARIVNDPALVARIRKSLLGFSTRPGHGEEVLLLDATGQPGERIPLGRLFTAGVEQTFTGASRGSTVTARTEVELARRLAALIGRNRRSRIATAQELRQHLVNLVSTAIRDRSGRVRFAGQPARLLTLELAQEAFLAQGITIAGPSVEEAVVTGNRIENALDGIRIAASSDADPVPATWRTTMPPNTVRRARINGNSVMILPLSDSVEAHGIYLGHVDSVSVGENDLTCSERVRNLDRPRPHFGLYQHGYRGARLTVTENTARSFHTGFAIVPAGIDPSGGVGIWRLRDNAPRACIRPYAVAPDVMVT
jgi:hypothetical protein